MAEVDFKDSLTKPSLLDVSAIREGERLTFTRPRIDLVVLEVSNAAGEVIGRNACRPSKKLPAELDGLRFAASAITKLVMWYQYRYWRHKPAAEIDYGR